MMPESRLARDAAVARRTGAVPLLPDDGGRASGGGGGGLFARLFFSFRVMKWTNDHVRGGRACS